jgi:hypothetical protein
VLGVPLERGTPYPPPTIHPDEGMKKPPLTLDERGLSLRSVVRSPKRKKQTAKRLLVVYLRRVAPTT